MSGRQSIDYYDSSFCEEKVEVEMIFNGVSSLAGRVESVY
ncbi:MAG: hypothetical protein ACI9SC_000544 [Gammaproteobacteria bacterium]|jgi:hypothetical protein